MLFNYQNVDFDIDEGEISKEECIKLFTPIIDIVEKFVKIVEINVESSEYAVILIEGGDGVKFVDEVKCIEELRNHDINTSTSDEDYGELEAINIYMEG